jgi:hypothetical protein
MPHNRKKKEQEIRSRFEFVVFADTEASIFNAALGVVDAIVSGGTYTLQYIQSELGDFGIKAASEMTKAGVNPVSEPIYSDVMTFQNWEQPIPGTKIPLPNKFVPYVAARKRKDDSGSGAGGRVFIKSAHGEYFLNHRIVDRLISLESTSYNPATGAYDGELWRIVAA